MKLFCCLLLWSFSALAQVELLQNFDKKSYTPRLKAITDIVVELENDKIKDQLNEQKIFGHIKNLSFRFYWTAQPERLAVEIIGLPEGFKEVKEELKANVLPTFENVVPLPLEKKFANFALTRKSKNVINAKDKNSLAAVTSHDLVFNAQEALSEIISHRSVGEMVSKYVYDKTSFSDGRWVLKAQETLVEEGGQKMSVKKEISYHVVAGAGFPQEVNVRTRQQGLSGNFENTESIRYKNYSVNKGDALKFFLSEGK